MAQSRHINVWMVTFFIIGELLKFDSAPSIYCQNYINFKDDCGYICGQLNSKVNTSSSKCIDKYDKSNFQYLIHHKPSDGNDEITEIDESFDFECVPKCPNYSSISNHCFDNQGEYESIKIICKLDESTRILSALRNSNTDLKYWIILVAVLLMILIVFVLVFVKEKKCPRNQIGIDDFNEIVRDSIPIFKGSTDELREEKDVLIFTKKFPNKVLSKKVAEFFIDLIYEFINAMNSLDQVPKFRILSNKSGYIRVCCKGIATYNWLCCIIQHPKLAHLSIELKPLSFLSQQRVRFYISGAKITPENLRRYIMEENESEIKGIFLNFKEFLLTGEISNESLITKNWNNFEAVEARLRSRGRYMNSPKGWHYFFTLTPNSIHFLKKTRNRIKYDGKIIIVKKVVNDSTLIDENEFDCQIWRKFSALFY